MEEFGRLMVGLASSSSGGSGGVCLVGEDWGTRSMEEEWCWALKQVYLQLGREVAGARECGKSGFGR